MLDEDNCVSIWSHGTFEKKFQRHFSVTEGRVKIGGSSSENFVFALNKTYSVLSMYQLTFCDGLVTELKKDFKIFDHGFSWGSIDFNINCDGKFFALSISLQNYFKTMVFNWENCDHIYTNNDFGTLNLTLITSPELLTLWTLNSFCSFKSEKETRHHWTGRSMIPIKFGSIIVNIVENGTRNRKICTFNMNSQEVVTYQMKGFQDHKFVTGFEALSKSTFCLSISPHGVFYDWTVLIYHIQNLKSPQRVLRGSFNELHLSWDFMVIDGGKTIVLLLLSKQVKFMSLLKK